MRDENARRTAPDPWEIGFGAFFVLFAGLCLWVWFPKDIIGAAIETNAVGRIGPGDAFFPVILAVAILVLGMSHLVAVVVRAQSGDGHGRIGRISGSNLWFLAQFHLFVFLGLGAMYALGPIAVAATNAVLGTEATYRQLLDTIPYKYVGFGGGGAALTIPIIVWAEGRLRIRSIVSVLAVILVTIILYDVLLKNVQLPPNSDY